MRVEFHVNGVRRQVDVDPQTPLLWVLRDELLLNGTKYGCGMGSCGACTVHRDGEPVRSCIVPIVSVNGRQVATIEGLSANGNHALERAWLDEDVSQCGYCQPGQLMSAAALLARTPNPTDDEIDTAMRGNLCRCGTYQRIRKAIHRAATMVPAAQSGERHS